MKIHSLLTNPLSSPLFIHDQVLGVIVLLNFSPRSIEFIMAENKIKAEGESNGKSAGKQALEVDEATLKGKETYKC